MKALTKSDTVKSVNFTTGPVAVVAHRITSIDLLRGIVMIIMAYRETLTPNEATGKELH